MLKIIRATILLSTLLALSACRPRLADGSGLRSAAVSTCPTQKVNAKDLNNIIITFPAECLAAQIKATLTENFDELNATHPKYFSGREFRAVDANIALTSDKISLDGEVTIQNNLAVFNIKDTVGYRIKVDAKEPRYGEAWMGVANKVEILVKDWVTVQNVKQSQPDNHFGAGNEDDRKRINTFIDFGKTVSTIIEFYTGMLTLGFAPVSVADAQAAKMKKAMATGLLEATKDDPSLKSLIPPEYAAFKLDEAYIATGAIENNALILKLTPRKTAAATKPKA